MTRRAELHTDGCVFIGIGATVDAAIADAWRRTRQGDEPTLDDVCLVVERIEVFGKTATPAVHVHCKVSGNVRRD